jgi:branched-chain amino acid transport system substrate-binding protein
MVFAAETYDAVVLAAVAAAAAEDDAGTSIAASLVAVSGGTAAAGAPGGGQPASQPPSESCRSYRDCADALRAGKRPDYDGQSGRINFDSHGDITEANYMVYTYGEDNLPTAHGTEAASSSGG